MLKKPDLAKEFNPQTLVGFLIEKTNYEGGEKIMNIKKILVGTSASAVMLGSMAIPALAAGNPSADADCSTFIAAPGYDLLPGTRADIYGCKSIGNSGQEQGIYTISAPAADLGYPAEYGTCTVLVKWSGDYGETPYLDFGTVFNNTKCSNGYVEIWGDRFDEEDAYEATPYVFSIGGQGSQIHP